MPPRCHRRRGGHSNSCSYPFVSFLCTGKPGRACALGFSVGRVVRVMAESGEQGIMGEAWLSRGGAYATVSESLTLSFNALPRAVIDKPQVPQMPQGREKTGLQPTSNH